MAHLVSGPHLKAFFEGKAAQMAWAEFIIAYLNDETNEPSNDMANPVLQGGSVRTVCVRTCDGYYFPISYATNASRFAQDEKTCQRLCPAAEVQLFAYPTEGGDIAQATSTSGAPYSQLPNAFKYRQSFDAACSCKKPGQSWADALGKDEAVEAGDIVVTEDRAKQLSQPPSVLCIWTKSVWKKSVIHAGDTALKQGNGARSAARATRQTTSAPIPTFASYRGALACERRNQRSTRRPMILVRFSEFEIPTSLAAK